MFGGIVIVVWVVFCFIMSRKSGVLRELLLLLLDLRGGLGGGALLRLGGDGLDDADGDSLPHVTHGEATERGEVGEGLDAHGLGGDQLHDAGVAGLDELGVGLCGLASTTVDLLLDLGELAGDVSGVAVENRRVPVADLAGVVQDDDLSGEVGAAGGRLVLGVGGDEAALDVLDGDVLDVESHVVSGGGPGTSPSVSPSRTSTKLAALERCPWAVSRPASSSPACWSPSRPPPSPPRSSPWRCTTSPSPRPPPETTWESTSRTSPSRTSSAASSPPTPRTSRLPAAPTSPLRSSS